MSETHSIETRAIHAGEPRPRIRGAIVTPIFQSSTYDYTGETDYHKIEYLRLNNTPNHHVLNAKVAALERTEAALVAASGMAVVSTTLLTVLGAGDHILAQKCLYAGTHGLLTKDFPSLNIAHSLIDVQKPDTWPAAMNKNTKAIYVETIANPMLEVPDLESVVRFAREHRLISIIDNTFASPVNFRPSDIGFDLTIESATKYLNGHDDIVAGAVAGSTEQINRIKRRLDHLGGALDPHAAFLLSRGLKTLAVRVRYQNESAGRLAQFLAKHTGVEHVIYPGLTSHPQHARAASLFEGFGGMVSFELRGGAQAADRFLSRVKLPAVAPSLGGVDSLAVRPSKAVHTNLSPEERAKSGISDGLIRLSVGLEGTDDLIADFEQALG